MVSDSILLTIKKLLGIMEDYTVFDEDIIVHINSSLMTLNQIGVGGEKPFLITGKEQNWNELSDNIEYLQAIKTYIYISVRLIFDPPSSSYVLTALKEQLKEYEWRINIMGEGVNDE